MGKAMTVRCIALSLVVVLYFVPVYQRYWADQPGGWNKVEIATPKDEQGSTSDIPYYAENFVNQAKPGVMCHVSTIAVAGKRKLICTWYAGSREAAPDVAIYCSYFSEDNGKWADPEVLINPQQSSRELQRWVRKVGNAVVFNDNRGGLWLFYASMAFGGWSATSLNYKVSRDEGKTWSDSKKLLLSPFFNLTNNVKNQGITLSQGAFLLPVYHEFIRKFSQMILFFPGNGGLAYEIRKMTHAGRAIQPALVHQGRKNLKAFFRNMTGSREKYILTAASGDVGRTWSDLSVTPLPNPNSGFDMVTLSDGSYLGVINNSFQDRGDLTLVLSRDGGMTWNPVKILENTPGQEYSYPFIIREKHEVHLTYTYERRRIKHVVFNEAWLKGCKEYGN